MWNILASSSRNSLDSACKQMSGARIHRILIVYLVIFAAPLMAQPIGTPFHWSTQSGGNGHWYLRLAGDWNGCEAWAQAACPVSGHLATVNSAAEQQFLVQSVGPFMDTPVSYHPNRYWIGFSDAGHEGQWVWVSGEPVTYLNWGPGEPNNNVSGSDYAYLGRYANGQWNDGPLAGTDKGIAEFVQEPHYLFLSSELTSEQVCPAGTATFSVTAAGSASFAYQWQWQEVGAPGVWINLIEGPNTDAGGIVRFTATGTNDANVAVFRDNHLQGSLDVIHALRCVVTNSCGSVTSEAATLTVVTTGDMNCDCRVNGLDIAPFVEAVLNPSEFSGCDILHGDVNADTAVDHFDVSGLVNCALTGVCP